MCARPRGCHPGRAPPHPRELSHAGRRVPAPHPRGALPRRYGRHAATGSGRSCSSARRALRRGSRCCSGSWRSSRRRPSRTCSDPRPANLIGFVKRDSTHWRSASWRDSDAGYANGRYAMDINAIWAPRALEAIERHPVRPSRPRHRAGDARLARARRARGAAGRLPGRLEHPPPRRRHLVRSPPALRGHARLRDEIARRDRGQAGVAPGLGARLLEAGAPGRPDSLRDSLTFLALSLDSAGHRSPSSTPTPPPSCSWTRRSGRPGQLEAIEAVPRALPRRPVRRRAWGRWSPTMRTPSAAVWDTFAKDAYHGPRVVWGREVNLLLLGLSLRTGAAPDAARQPAGAGAPRPPCRPPSTRCAPQDWSTASSGATGSRAGACGPPATAPAPTCSSGAAPISPCSIVLSRIPHR